MKHSIEIFHEKAISSGKSPKGDFLLKNANLLKNAKVTGLPLTKTPCRLRRFDDEFFASLKALGWQ